MTQSKNITALLTLTIIIAICFSVGLIALHKNTQLALISTIIPICLLAYLSPRYVYLAILIVLNLSGLYLSGKIPPPVNINILDWIVFDIISIFLSEFLIKLKTTHSKKVEQLTKRDLILSNILKFINAGVLIFENNELFFINEQLCKITGYSMDEMKDLTFLDLIHPDEKHKLSDLTYHDPHAATNHTIQFWIKNKNGEERFIKNSYFYFQLNASNTFEMIITSDLTDQKRKEEILELNQKSLDRILSNLPGLAYRRKNDSSYKMKYVSKGAKALTGHPPATFLNNKTFSYEDLIYSEDRESVQSKIKQNASIDEAFQLIYRIITSESETKWVWEQGRVVPDFNNKIDPELEGFIIDITDYVLANQALSQSEQKYKTLANSITDMFMAVDKNLTITYWNTASEKMTGISSQRAMGKAIHKIFPTIQGFALDESLEDALKQQKSRRFVQKLRINGEEPFIEINIYPSAYGVAIFGRDVTEKIEAENQLKYLSTHDALTRIYNRAYFETEMERLQNSRLFPISIVMADLDGLKYVNDSQGHSAGDELLRQTANLLRESFRTEDVVARIGGDEFGVLIANTGVDAVHNAIKRVRAKIQQHNKSHPNLKIKLSIGVATTQIGEKLEITSKRADKKMYEDKSTHKGDTRELKPN